MAEAANQLPKCPECTSQQVWKDGVRYTKHGEVQRWLCRVCGHRFSDSKVEENVLKQRLVLSDAVHDFGDLNRVNLSVGKVGLKDSTLAVRKDVGSHGFSVIGKSINNFLRDRWERQVCATEKEAKNLSQQRPHGKRAAGATKPTRAELKGRLVEHAFWLKKNGYAESTITKRTYVLKSLMKQGANLLDPESVKEALAHRKCSENTKASIVYTYDTFLKMTGIKWSPPRYKQTRKLPFIPSEIEIDQLIARAFSETLCS